MEVFFSPDLNKKPEFNQVFFDNLSKSNWSKKAVKIKNKVLSSNYILSINFISKAEIQKLNLDWRRKDSPTDILSFTYTETEGELFLCPEVITNRHREFKRDLGNFVWFLYIHGLHHLKGIDHGPEMDEAEEDIRLEFNI